MFPAGFALGVGISAILWVSLVLGVLTPMTHAEQFKQDCRSMAHGTVLKDSPRICRKGNTILFTAK